MRIGSGGIEANQSKVPAFKYFSRDMIYGSYLMNLSFNLAAQWMYALAGHSRAALGENGRKTFRERRLHNCTFNNAHCVTGAEGKGE